MSGFLLIVFLALTMGLILLKSPPEKLARAIRFSGPVIMIGIGVVLLFLNRIAAALPLIGFGLALYGRARSVRPIGGSTAGPSSNVRSAALEMELDHDTGEMDGMVLAGSFEGRVLSDLSETELQELLLELKNDEESLLLLQAYFDRRIPGWRENANSGFGSGHVAASGTGPMSKQEAYEVLGLGPEAGPGDIRKAHRRLMKGMHPDSGGSTFLATKINEAKEVLLDGHS